MADTNATESAVMQVEPKKVREVATERQLCRVRFSPCGKFLFGGGYDGLVRRWNFSAEEPIELAPLTGHHGWVQQIEFSADGRTMFSADSWGQLCAWPYQAEQPEPLWKNETAHDGWIYDFSLTADGQRIATAGRDGLVKVWSAADGKLLHELPRHEHQLCRVAIHPDGKSVVSSDLFGTLRHYEVETGKLVRERTFEKLHFYKRIQDVPGIYILRFHDDGRTLLCGGGEPNTTGRQFAVPTLHFVNWESFEPTTTRQFGAARFGFIYDVAWHPDGWFALVTSGTPGAGQLVLARPEDEKPFFSSTKFANCHSVVFNPAGTQIIVADTNRSSQGNGAVRNKDGTYRGNTSPLYVFDLASASADDTGKAAKKG